MNDKQFKVLCYFLWRIATSGKITLFSFEEEYAMANTISGESEDGE